ncbi:MAG: 4'-phosphopantetheinyl transferase superfamily protein [Acidobacteriia bacterium]|nr:4'-phosphopantetheinyl transferase superfamily protein [Terriglobia bacterium]
MIVGLGIDLIANSRVQRELARAEWRLGDGIFTSREISRCNRDRRPALCYAACFAAKEATLKALGVLVADLGMLREVEVELGDGCAIVLHDRMKSESERLGVRHVRLSLAPGKRQTGALVILES